MARAKLIGDSWKNHFWKNFKAGHHMTKEKFNYYMCPIRHFKEIVKFVDNYQNFVFAADVNGNVAIFLINEADMENDDETL
jgi:hypothetical protein